MLKQRPKTISQEPDFLEFEPYRQGYKSQGKNKGNSRYCDVPWQLGSLGYYLFKQGLKDAQAKEEIENKAP
jgi:hypothetical protein